MSMACRGITHCRECWAPLDISEFGLCKTCEQKEEKEAKDTKIQQLEDENAKLKRTLQRFYNAEIFTAKQIRVLQQENICKKVIRSKIKELRQDIEKGNTRYPYILGHKIDVLEELLEVKHVPRVVKKVRRNNKKEIN